jgi:poly(3-hydroxybutyrate) depolymerase
MKNKAMPGNRVRGVRWGAVGKADARTRVRILVISLVLAALVVLVAGGIGIMMYLQTAASSANREAPHASAGNAIRLAETLAAETAAVRWSVAYTNTKSKQAATRSCWVTVPPGFSAAAAGEKFPVFFFFHGTSASSSAAEVACRQLVGSGCMCFVLQGSELVSEPVSDTSSVYYSWDVNDLTGADDLSLVRALYTLVAKDARADLTRCFACGHSVGSLFVGNVLAPQTTFFTGGHLCLSSQLLMSTDLSGVPAGVKIVFLNGDADPLIPFDGGAASFDASLVFHPVTDAVALWAAQNTCTAPVMETQGEFLYFPTSSQPSSSVTATFTRYTAVPCTRGLVAGYILSGTANYPIEHDTIVPALNLFGVANTAALALAVFGDAV